jgi:hypothetical protein
MGANNVGMGGAWLMWYGGLDGGWIAPLETRGRMQA